MKRITLTSIAVASVMVLGSYLVAERPSGTATAAASNASALVADPGTPARRLGNQRVVADPPPPPPTADLAAEVIAITNAERAAAGLAPLTAHPQLTTAAFVHSRDQAAMGQMTHTGSDGSNAGTRIERAGYPWRSWGENVAMGYRTASSVMDGWMGSTGHRHNILSASFVHIGIAVVTGADGRTYWTMVLASRR